MLLKSTILISVIALFGLIFIVEKEFQFPFDSVNITQKENSLPVEKYLLVDLTGIVFGIRRLAADIAWIQVLQYYGTPEEECSHEHEHSADTCPYHSKFYGKGKYYDLLKLCLRVIRLDPYFHYAYLYGSASLTWNLERPDEGLLLLDEGIKRYPKNRHDYWQLYLYKMAIIYKKAEKYKDMVLSLEKAVNEKNCPLMVKAILANIYKRFGNYHRAIVLWQEIYNYGMSDYSKFAEKQIRELQKLLNSY
ncbi:MAG: hypothetical protein QME68_07950 [Elusimicrobiota bacterium]|nr:hypothetical protein [Elusimicrobiota bacterium]